MLSLHARPADAHAFFQFHAAAPQAVKAFLADMGISFDQLLGRPILVDLILAYHFVPGVTITSFYEQNKADESKPLISR